MGTLVTVAILALVFTLGIVYTVKHFKGEGGCCGGGSYRPKKKRLSAVKYQKTFSVGGMHCEHCKRRVEEVVNDIRGVAGRVDLKKGILTVSYEVDVEDSVIVEAILRAGYTVEP